MSERLARALRAATDTEVEHLLFIELEELLRYPAPPQIAVLAGALQCDLARLLGIIDGGTELLPRALATAPESHIGRFQTLVRNLPGAPADLRAALAEHIDDSIAAVTAVARTSHEGLDITIDWSICPDGAIVALSGEVDRGTLPALRAAVASAARPSRHTVVIDLCAVTVLTPSALAALTELQSEAHARGRRFVIVARGAVRRLMTTLGHDSTFSVHATVNEACTQLPQPIN